MINILLIYINIEFAFKWIGFTRKDNAKCLLQKYFVINKDYFETLNIYSFVVRNDLLFFFENINIMFFFKTKLP